MWPFEKGAAELHENQAASRVYKLNLDRWTSKETEAVMAKHVKATKTSFFS